MSTSLRDEARPFAWDPNRYANKSGCRRKTGAIRAVFMEKSYHIRLSDGARGNGMGCFEGNGVRVKGRGVRGGIPRGNETKSVGKLVLKGG